MNFYQNRGELVLGSRLKRLSEKFLMEIAKIYDSLDIDFEISWFPIFYLLGEKKELSVTEISREMEVTHSAVSQLLTVLQKRGLVEMKSHEDDKRKRVVYLTKDGVKLLKKVKPVWDSISRIFKQLLSEGEYSTYLLQGLTEIEEKIKTKDIKTSVLRDIEQSTSGIPQLIDYDRKYEDQYKQFLLEWVMQHDETDSTDTEFINDPETIIKTGAGYIQLAELNDNIIGAIVTKNNSNQTAELVFLLVDEAWQNRKIGKSLLEEAVNYHKLKSDKKLFASVSKTKMKAVNMLKNSGFVFGNMKTVKNKSGSETTMIFLENNLL